jgi:hypothetical protein
MPHPLAVRCIAETIEAALKSRQREDTLAATDGDDMDRLAKSREAIVQTIARQIEAQGEVDRLSTSVAFGVKRHWLAAHWARLFEKQQLTHVL